MGKRKIIPIDNLQILQYTYSMSIFHIFNYTFFVLNPPQKIQLLKYVFIFRQNI